LGLSFVVDVGKAAMWWNSGTNAGRAALCWKLDFDVETDSVVALEPRKAMKKPFYYNRKSVKIFFFLYAFCF